MGRRERGGGAVYLFRRCQRRAIRMGVVEPRSGRLLRRCLRSGLRSRRAASGAAVIAVYGTISTVAVDGTVIVDHGTVTARRGAVTTRHRTVTTRHGTVAVHRETVTARRGTDAVERETVTARRGTDAVERETVGSGYHRATTVETRR